MKEKFIMKAWMDGESSDIFFPSWVDSYYANRPEELEYVNLHDFWYGMTWYNLNHNILSFPKWLF